MSFLTQGIIISRNLLIPKYNHNFKTLGVDSCKVLQVQVRCYAARKGTRERKKKSKVKVELQKVGFIPHNQRNKDDQSLNRVSKKFDDSWKKDPIDNVYVAKYFKWIVYPFVEALECHRETHHPEMYNKPEADLHSTIELNMQGEKKTRFVDNFTRIVHVPHPFEHGEERSVIAFAKNSDTQQEATNAGAQLCGGTELIKQIQNGQVLLSNFQYVVAHPDILPELVALRGIMKRRFPNPKAGTLDADLGATVHRFMHGISYTAAKDEFEKDFGVIDTVIGTLNMDAKHLEANFATLIKDVNSMKPKREGAFITRCLLWSPPSSEKLMVDYNAYISIEESREKVEEEEEVEERVTL